MHRRLFFKVPGRWFANPVITALLFFLVSCGGGGNPNPTRTVTVTGEVQDGDVNSPIPNAVCRFVDSSGVQHSSDTCNTKGVFSLSVPLDAEGYILCSPQSLPKLQLSTYVSTVGMTEASQIEHENVTPATTLTADIILHEKPPDPVSRKAELLHDILTGADANLVLVAEMTRRLFKAMLVKQVNLVFGADGGDPDPPSPSDHGVSGDAGDGADFSPLAGAECSFVVGDQPGTSAQLDISALADFRDDGQLNRPDLAHLYIEVPEGKSAEDIQHAFETLFPDGIGQAVSAVTNEKGEYFLPVPAGIPGYVRCTPATLNKMVLTTYVPGRPADTSLEGQDVNPATTVFSTLVATQLHDDLATIKENYLDDIEGLQLKLDWPDYPDGMLSGFLAETGLDTNAEVGLVAFSATALFNALYKNALNVDFLAAIEDLAEEASVDADFLTTAGLPAEQAQSLANMTNTAITRVGDDWGTNLDKALSTARVNVTVMVGGTDGGLIEGATVSIDEAETSLSCTSGCGDPTNQDGQVTLTLSGVPRTATEIEVTVGSVSGFEPQRVAIDVVAFVTVDQEVTFTPPFEKPSYELVVQGGGNGNGLIASTPDGIDCTLAGSTESGVCNASFESGSAIELQAIPAEDGSVFSGWSGGTCGPAEEICTLSLDENITVTALFTHQCTDDEITIDQFQATIGAGGGAGNIQVTAPDSCDWRASSDRSWLRIVAADGRGNGTVNYLVAENTSGDSRAGAITIADKTHRVTQTACTITISPLNRSISHQGGDRSVSVTAPTGCEWQASVDVAWINIETGSVNGSGNGSVPYTVRPNRSVPERIGVINIAGQAHKVTQEAAPCSFSVDPIRGNASAAGGAYQVSVDAIHEGCLWSTSESVSWISLSPENGTGDGVVTITASRNPGNDRSATLQIAGVDHRVIQPALCSYSLSPANSNFNQSGGSGEITVTPSASGCTDPWTATTQADWIRILGFGSSGYSVAYEVSAYNGYRTATITVMGQTHTVKQFPHPPGVPTLISPAEDAVISSSAGGDIDIAFDWSDVPGATKYQIIIRTGEGSLIGDTIVTGSNYSLSYPAIEWGDDEGRWSVRAGHDHYGYDVWGEWAELSGTGGRGRRFYLWQAPD